ncbi:hypothetical protein EMIHUDRAFT_108891 [Emiliania huxleyi CCMP1516]|uniref:Prokaryotic STING domain-containing protein n=2 Tax=Emiliania huxleyi TaxID=2903 RepID=A0A0D3KUA7_EMIH1|nr:hypothetical protein EMIHUDRAFT_108891 [Emiliania huxleyi CCMP1516]EOD39342.1 hypothetical protein EMIHUDRAFT_108891 [Emiliania huxleyi CCMP1516]|eukprot:XP_005791771.1 hypothetical protein EMIHUDRAFT_108891 [Emiliania huxleyi CCMP1516]
MLVTQPLHADDVPPGACYELKAPLKEAPRPVGGWDARRIADFALFATLAASGAAHAIYTAMQEANVTDIATDSATLHGRLLAGMAPHAGAEADKETFHALAGSIGLMLFDAALLPFVLATWAALLGLGTRRAKDVTRAAIALVLLVLALLFRSDTEPVTRGELFELAFIVGTVHFVNNLLMLEDDPEADVAALVRKYRRALSLAGTGIAMGYFFNFVLPIVRAIDGGRKRLPGSAAATPLPIMLDGKNEALRGSCALNILIPRDLPDAYLRDAIRKLASPSGTIIGDQSFRPMPVTFLPLTDGITDGMFDIPTAVNALYQRRCHQKELDEKDEKAMEEEDPAFNEQAFNAVERHISAAMNCAQQRLSRLPVISRSLLASLRRDDVAGANTATAGAPVDTSEVSLAFELADFANALIGLIERDPLARKHVRVWSVPPPPFDMQMIAGLCRACDDTPLPNEDNNYKSAMGRRAML